MAEAKIVAYDQITNTEPVYQYLVDKAVSRHRRQPPIEFQRQHRSTPYCCRRATFPQPHQPRRRGFGAKNSWGCGSKVITVSGSPSARAGSADCRRIA